MGEAFIVRRGGANGPTWYKGEDDPADDLGKDGDIYFQNVEEVILP